MRLVSCMCFLGFTAAKYESNWESLATRPLPTWFDEAKVGIFIHWGVSSVPGFGSEWFWKDWIDGIKTEYRVFMEKNYRPGFTYQEFSHDFKAEFFEPDKWAEIFNAAGAKYVVLTSKHHDGFALWPTKFSSEWNAKDRGPGQDLVGNLAKSVRKYPHMKFGIYHSLYEWFNPMWLADAKNNFQTTKFVTTKIQPQLHELVENYKPDVIWSDGEDYAPSSYWNSTAFLAWLYNESPVRDTVVTNDRWGVENYCAVGDFYTCDDRYNPRVLLKHKWENAMTLDKLSWSHRRNAQLSDFITYEELMDQLVSTVSCGGNILVNIGPTKEGMITPIDEERLRQMGKWLQVNGEAIYSSKPWTYQNETVQTGVWYTKREGFVYASVLDRPANNKLILHRPLLNKNTAIFILGTTNSTTLKWSYSNKKVEIILPDVSQISAPLPWMLKFTNVSN